MITTSRTKTGRPHTGGGRAFTLVELLVVIGIIALLISILLPTVRKARRQAATVKCTATVRSLVQACQTVAQQHKGYYPIAGNLVAAPWAPSMNAGMNDVDRKRYSYATMWGNTYVPVPLPAALAEFLGITGLPDDWNELDKALNAKDGVWRHFMCPQTDALDKAKLTSDPDDTNWVDQGTMIQTNLTGAIWATNSDYGFNEGVLGYHYDGRWSANRLAGNSARIRRPSETALFTDAVPRKTAPLPSFPYGWICWTPLLNNIGPCTLGDALADNGKVASKESFDFQRHDGRINVAFADGHVETLPIEQKALERVYLIAP